MSGERRLPAERVLPDLSPSPPCIVLGVEGLIGLALVRELGRAGIRVVAVSHELGAIGLHSRHAWRRVHVPALRSEDTLALLRALGEELGTCSLLTVSEVNIQWLHAHADQLGRVRAALPPAAAFAVALDKSATLRAAEQVGLAVPQSLQPRNWAEARAAAADFPLPAVLKWADPNQVAPRLSRLGLALVKAEYVHTREAFAAVMDRYAALGEWPLLQQYCPGRGLGQFFFMHQGEVLQRFQHLRVAEWPPEGGFSSVCDAIPLDMHRTLQEKSLALLRAIGWQGVAMVEYRWDAASDSAMLMEINGRFWGSYPLAMHCGAGFALLMHHMALGNPLPRMPPARADLRARTVTTELKRLARLLLAPGRIQDPHFRIDLGAELSRFVLDFVRPRVRYFLWTWSDPLPFFIDLRNLASKLMASVRRNMTNLAARRPKQPPPA